MNELFLILASISLILIIIASWDQYGEFVLICFGFLAFWGVLRFIGFLNKKKIQKEATIKHEMEQDEIKRKAQEEAIQNEVRQQEYKQHIENLYLEIKNLKDAENAIYNFLLKVPQEILLSSKLFTFFETLILGETKEGEKLLWSSKKEIEEIKGYSLERSIACQFYYDVFIKMVRFLSSLKTIDNKSDYKFVLLKLIQLAASSKVYANSEFKDNIEFSAIEDKSLEDILFTFYSNFREQATFDNDLLLTSFTHFLIHNQKFGKPDNIDFNNFLLRRKEVLELLEEKKEEFDYRIFEKEIKKEKAIEGNLGISIIEVDLMSGEEFENFVAQLFSKMGYRTTVTQHSGDYGVDVIAEKDSLRIGIQTKCYANPVSVSAIQEISAGIKHYNCQKGIVVTNNFFTKPALELANSNKIQLWDRKILNDKIEIYLK